jgi:hypothetical protein
MNTPAYFAIDDTSLFTIDDLELPGFYIGSDNAGGFASGDASFNTYFSWDDTYGPYWEGFAYSHMTDTTTAGYENQYSAITGQGVDGSANYAVGYVGYMGYTPEITLDTPAAVSGVYVTNTTYAYLSIRDGDSFTDPFGGPGGEEEDYFKLTIEGFDDSDASTGTVEFYLADYRFADNSQDYIVDQWTWVDLSTLGTVARLQFTLESSDSDPTYGMNTPAYFAIDDFDGDAPSDGSGGSGGCFIASAQIDPSGIGMASMLAMLCAGLCILCMHRK